MCLTSDNNQTSAWTCKWSEQQTERKKMKGGWHRVDPRNLKWRFKMLSEKWNEINNTSYWTWNDGTLNMRWKQGKGADGLTPQRHGWLLFFTVICRGKKEAICTSSFFYFPFFLILMLMMFHSLFQGKCEAGWALGAGKSPPARPRVVPPLDRGRLPSFLQLRLSSSVNQAPKSVTGDIY